MNLSKNLSLYIIILLSIGCGTKSSNNFLAGYLSPGDFCSKGVASEKAYRFTNVPNLPAPASVRNECSSTSPIVGKGICAAVHCNWYVSQSLTSLNNALLTEGIAVNDKHLPNPTFNLKISRIPGLLEWQISLVLNGVNYTVSPETPVNIRLTPFDSDDTEDQTFNTTTNVCNPSTKPLKLIYIEFLNDIRLVALNNPTSPDIIIGATATTGDFIIAQHYRIF